MQFPDGHPAQRKSVRLPEGHQAVDRLPALLVGPCVPASDDLSAWRMTSSASLNVPVLRRWSMSASTSDLVIWMVTGARLRLHYLADSLPRFGAGEIHLRRHPSRRWRAQAGDLVWCP